MAYNSGSGLASLAGIVGGGIGGYLGYNQAIEIGMAPFQGAIIMGAIGFVAGSAGAFVLKSLMQFFIYIVLFALLAYFFREQVATLTGIDPVAAVETALGNFGIKADLAPD